MTQRILLAEDEDDARTLLAEGLERRGFAVVAAADGAAAADLLDGSFDAVVTDLVMPRLDGLELLRRVPRTDPGALRLVITSFADKERAVAALNLGADYLLEKPFTARQLAELLTRLLDQRGEVADTAALFARRLDQLGLSDRERQLATLVLKGLGNAEIARVTASTEPAVRNALLRMYQRLGIGSRGELFHLVFPI
ncbi:MAG: response regulator [Planctomycetes bacterium]|nr:response regulator [Planctomycetota bacterium]